MSTPAHLVYVASVDEDGNVGWGVSCPWEPDDDKRDCLYGSEPRGICLWQLWENDDHYPDCDNPDLCNGLHLVDGEEAYVCWDSRPDECDGFTSSEGDHCHPDIGCGVIEWMGHGGVGDTVFFDSHITAPPVPLPVHVSWDPDGGVILAHAQPEGE